MIQLEKTRFKPGLLAVVALLTGFAQVAVASQFDAEHYELEKQFGDQWQEDDRAVQAKLDELERRH